jgi:uncharacterized oxidoreductase
MRMSGNTMLITGGTSGIGLGLAERFYAEGNTVIVAGRRADLLASITAAHPGMDSVILDIDDADSIRRGIARVLEQHPDLDVVINNAGIMRPEHLTDPKHLDVAEQTVVTNLLGPIRLLAEVLPHLAAQPTATIMNVSSGLAFVPLPLTPTYCATKAAIHSYTQSLRVQLADTDVQVLELIPPGVQTDLMGQAARGQGMPLQAFLSEVMDLLRSNPETDEICVQDVLLMRNAEADGRHDDVLAMLSGAH